MASVPTHGRDRLRVVTALATAAELLERAAAELDAASVEVPKFAEVAVRAHRREVLELVRRLGNTRRVLGDTDPERPGAA